MGSKIVRRYGSNSLIPPHPPSRIRSHRGPAQTPIIMQLRIYRPPFPGTRDNAGGFLIKAQQPEDALSAAVISGLGYQETFDVNLRKLILSAIGVIHEGRTSALQILTVFPVFLRIMGGDCLLSRGRALSVHTDSNGGLAIWSGKAKSSGRNSMNQMTRFCPPSLSLLDSRWRIQKALVNPCFFSLYDKRVGLDSLP